MRFLIYY